MTQASFVDSIIPEGRRVSVHRFAVRHTCDPDDLARNLRAAIRDFCRTPEGRRIARSNGRDFNWGDASVEIPAAFWRKYGIESFEGEDPNVKHLVVEHDENFYDEVDEP